MAGVPALRSVYHLKEGDPHTFAIPRLGGRAKAAMVEIQADEYGGGSLARMHSELFAGLMRDLDLDSAYGALWDIAPAAAFASVNTMSLFGLHRRWRGAAVGHLTAVEMTSSEPSRRYSAGLRRLGLGPGTTVFYDEHVEADAVHEQIAAVDMCGSLVAGEPALPPTSCSGPRLAGPGRPRRADLLGAWEAGRSALRGDLPARRLKSAATASTGASRPADRVIAQPNSGGQREHQHAVDRGRHRQLDAVQHGDRDGDGEGAVVDADLERAATACRSPTPSSRGTSSRR